VLGPYIIGASSYRQHHILYTRIPGYRRADLHQAQSTDKTVFEYWTHALSYLPTADMRFYLRRRMAALQFGTSTMMCWWRRTISGQAASLQSGRCKWRSTRGS
jgi:uncharacterized protein YcaQ